MDSIAAAAPAATSHGDDDVGGGGDAGSEHALATEEWLVARVLERVTDAREVFRLAVLNRNFWAASLSDQVWQKRLPPRPVLEAITAPVFSSKRDLYIRLCKSVTFDDGLKKFWLEPVASGAGECYMISARGLTIIWGDTADYWEWKPWPGAMFPEVAYLHSVCWFEIKGTFRQVLRPGKYLVSFRMQLHSFREWQGSPIKLCVQNITYAHPCHLSQVLFDNAPSKRRSCPVPKPSAASTSASPDTDEGSDDNAVWAEGSCDAFGNSNSPEWVECDVGEFLVEDDNIEGRPIEVEFSMREIDVLWWKGGFVLDGVIIRPYNVAEDATTE
ncbi:hypothetical protein GOP47_0015515 [Adiantum capillus-veneris]|uniref:Uncharacterized protein n=1 Tax=Adiantum capillus-veneris TaxID=13818 RepID=A0A9D4UJU4_ADICA|nr:hypothetical protein GOP47_0015515 [Adiantum capillus-veneris]